MSLSLTVVNATLNQPFCEWAEGNRPSNVEESKPVYFDPETLAVLAIHSYDPTLQNGDSRRGDATLATLAAEYGVSMLIRNLYASLPERDEPPWQTFDDAMYATLIAEGKGPEGFALPAWHPEGPGNDGKALRLRLSKNHWTAAGRLADLLGKKCNANDVVRYGVAGALTVGFDGSGGFSLSRDAERLRLRYEEIVGQIEWRVNDCLEGA